MFKNLFKTLLPKTTIYASPTAVAAEGEQRLKDAQKKLAELQEMYYADDYHEHPDDMWESISDYESMIETLLRAQKRGWVPNKRIIKEIKADMEKQRRYMAKMNYPQGIIDDEMAFRNQYLNDAMQGLR